MKEKKIATVSRRTKIIPIQWDANFFFERAVRSLDRYHYDKALKISAALPNTSRIIR